MPRGDATLSREITTADGRLTNWYARESTTGEHENQRVVGPRERTSFSSSHDHVKAPASKGGGKETGVTTTSTGIEPCLARHRDTTSSFQVRGLLLQHSHAPGCRAHTHTQHGNIVNARRPPLKLRFYSGGPRSSKILCREENTREKRRQSMTSARPRALKDSASKAARFIRVRATPATATMWRQITPTQIRYTVTRPRQNPLLCRPPTFRGLNLVGGEGPTNSDDNKKDG